MFFFKNFVWFITSLPGFLGFELFVGHLNNNNNSYLQIFRGFFVFYGAVVHLSHLSLWTPSCGTMRFRSSTFLTAGQGTHGVIWTCRAGRHPVRRVRPGETGDPVVFWNDRVSTAVGSVGRISRERWFSALPGSGKVFLYKFRWIQCKRDSDIFCKVIAKSIISFQFTKNDYIHQFWSRPSKMLLIRPSWLSKTTAPFDVQPIFIHFPNSCAALKMVAGTNGKWSEWSSSHGIVDTTNLIISFNTTP